MAEHNPVLVAVGWLLTVLGAVWVALTGGCTLVFAGGGLFSGGSNQEALASLPMILMIGAVCVAPGALMLWGGLAILKGQRRSA